MVKVPPWQCPSPAPAAPQGAPGGFRQLGTPREGVRPLSAQSLPQVLELAASKVADFAAVDRVGTASTDTSNNGEESPHTVHRTPCVLTPFITYVFLTPPAHSLTH